MKKTNSEKTYATLKPGKTYKFAGYSWTACEVNNDRHVAVIQSHGLTNTYRKESEDLWEKRNMRARSTWLSDHFPTVFFRLRVL